MNNQHALDLSAIEESTVDDSVKGVPAGVTGLAVKNIGRQGWNVLREDLPLPLAVLKRTALDHNVQWMRRFASLTGALLCPHGKTTMSPQLFDLQLRNGAWGVTAATISQVQVYRRYGVRRILLANQLPGRRNVDFILRELAQDPDFDFYCLVDSLANVALLRAAAVDASIGRPLQVLLEIGQQGGRTGARTFAQAMDVARAVSAARPLLALRGVEGYEGILTGRDEADTEHRIERLMLDMKAIARALAHERLFSEEPIILSAGGSAFFDFAALQLAGTDLGQQTLVVLRSGCYVTHDATWLADYERALRKRMPQTEALGPGLQAALEVWAYVQSIPEHNLAIATLGKRDCSYDIQLPAPIAWFRPGASAPPQTLGAGYRVSRLNDQHAYVDLPADSPLRVGDMLCFGIAHPCTTFDKWRLLPLVDDQYNVVGGVRTFF